jgi:hypothetical protein
MPMVRRLVMKNLRIRLSSRTQVRSQCFFFSERQSMLPAYVGSFHALGLTLVTGNTHAFSK